MTTEKTKIATIKLDKPVNGFERGDKIGSCDATILEVKTLELKVNAKPEITICGTPCPWIDRCSEARRNEELTV